MSPCAFNYTACCAGHIHGFHSRVISCCALALQFVRDTFPLEYLSHSSSNMNVQDALKAACLSTNSKVGCPRVAAVLVLVTDVDYLCRSRAAACCPQIRFAGIDASLSGTTLIVACLQGRTLTVANVGDSRAVLGRQSRVPGGDGPLGSRLQAIPLSDDHKPDMCVRCRFCNTCVSFA